MLPAKSVAYCNKLQTLKGTENIVQVGASSFHDCDIHGTLDLSAVTAMGSWALACNPNLESVSLGDTDIPDYAFSGCSGLKNPYLTVSCTDGTLGGQP